MLEVDRLSLRDAAPAAAIATVRAYTALFAAEAGRSPRAFVLTFGCQQNVADSEKLSGMAREMGYEIADAPEDADLILVNTCAIREHAEKRALSIVGQYKHLKEKNRGLLIGVCGCMVVQQHRREQLKKSYPYVDFVLGTSVLHRLPELLARKLAEKRRIFGRRRSMLSRRGCRSCGIAPTAPLSALCTAATIFAPIASCPTCAGGSAVARPRM